MVAANTRPQALTPFQQYQQAVQAQMAQLNSQIRQLQAAMSNQAVGGIASFPTKRIVPFIYLTQFTGTAVILPGATGTQVIQMAADSAFELWRIFCITSLDLPTDYAPNNCLISIQDGSSGQYFNSAAIPQAMMVTRSYQAGNEQKYPIQFPANAAVTVAVTSLQSPGGANLGVYFGLQGYKIFNTTPTAAG